MMSADDVRAVVEQLRSLSAEAPSDDLVGSEAIDTVRALEELKGACAGAQARVTAGFAADATGARSGAKGVPGSRRGQGDRGAGRPGAPGQPVQGVAASGVGRGVGARDAAHPGRPRGRAGSRSGGRRWSSGRPRACAREDRARGGRASSRARPGGARRAWATGRPRPKRRRRRLPAGPARGDEPGRASPRQDRRVTLRPAPDTMSRLTGTAARRPGSRGLGGARRARPTAAKAGGDARGPRAGHGRHAGRAGHRAGHRRRGAGRGAPCTITDTSLVRPGSGRQLRARRAGRLRPGPGRLGRAMARDHAQVGTRHPAAAGHEADHRAAGRDGVAVAGSSRPGCAGS